MAKRFTDTKKWRNEWFRTLPLKAKLTWIYLCDECENHGLMKMDYGLASFQLGFDVKSNLLKEWFGDKLHFLSEEKILIVQFFEFQYGDSKDSWSAKIEARKKLENLGFTIENNALHIFKKDQTDHSGVTVGDSTPTSLIRVRGRVNNNINSLHKLILIWNQYGINLQKVEKTNPARDKKIESIFSLLSEQEWIDVVTRINSSDFCKGVSVQSKGWKATFDWLLQKETYLKVLEGKYDNRVVSAKVEKRVDSNAVKKVNEEFEQFEKNYDGRGLEKAAADPAMKKILEKLRIKPDLEK